MTSPWYGRPVADLPSACVTGAGSSGIAALKALAEAQGRWIASYLRGEYRLPPRSEMEADMRRELRAGARRAREGGFRLPVAPHAHAHAHALAPATPHG